MEAIDIDGQTHFESNGRLSRAIPQPDHVFKGTGYRHYRKLFSPEALAQFETTLVSLYAQQARKIGDYRASIDRIDPNAPHGTNYHRLTTILNMMEENDKEALYQVQKLLPSSQQLRKLFDDEFLSICCGLLGSKPDNTLIDGPALFINRPSSQRLLYKWHSEAHYYPKRRRFLNIWFPLFTSKDEHNGAMQILPESHKKHWDFAEYTGFNKDSQDKKNHFVQYEIPESWLTQYRPHVCKSDPGDAIIFDRNLVHRSCENESQRISFAVVARVWTPEDDLTLSGNLAATPYGGDLGRANLVVAA